MQPEIGEDRDKPIAYTDGLLNQLDKVHAALDGADVHEALALIEVVAQTVEYAAGMSGTVVSPVADEDFRHRPYSVQTGVNWVNW